MERVIVRENADNGRAVRCCYGGLSYYRQYPFAPWPQSAPPPRFKESGPSRNQAVDHRQRGARDDLTRAAASAVAGATISTSAACFYAIHPVY